MGWLNPIRQPLPSAVTSLWGGGPPPAVGMVPTCAQPSARTEQFRLPCGPGSEVAFLSPALFGGLCISTPENHLHACAHKCGHTHTHPKSQDSCHCRKKRFSFPNASNQLPVHAPVVLLAISLALRSICSPFAVNSCKRWVS